MDATTLSRSLTTLFAELLDGPAKNAAYMLNSGDAGLLRSLGHVSAADASSATGGGATLAAHVDHLRYGLSLMNRWAAGEEPFADADWSASWRRTTVSDDEWRSLRADLGDEARRWQQALARPRRDDETEVTIVLSSIVHLAYHLGAIRQIAPAARGPKDGA